MHAPSSQAFKRWTNRFSVTDGREPNATYFVAQLCNGKAPAAGDYDESVIVKDRWLAPIPLQRDVAFKRRANHKPPHSQPIQWWVRSAVMPLELEC